MPCSSERPSTCPRPASLPLLLGHTVPAGHASSRSHCLLEGSIPLGHMVLTSHISLMCQKAQSISRGFLISHQGLDHKDRGYKVTRGSPEMYGFCLLYISSLEMGFGVSWKECSQRVNPEGEGPPASGRGEHAP